jgi:hypothetical protein
MGLVLYEYSKRPSVLFTPGLLTSNVCLPALPKDNPANRHRGPIRLIRRAGNKTPRLLPSPFAFYLPLPLLL